MGCAWLVSSSPSTAFVFALVSSVGVVSSSVATCAFWRRRALEVALSLFIFGCCRSGVLVHCRM